MHSFCTISDGGTIAGESALMAFPAITVRQPHERSEGMDEGVIVVSRRDKQQIIDSIDVVVKQFETIGPTLIPKDSDVEQLSRKIAKIIFNPVDRVSPPVWSKG